MADKEQKPSGWILRRMENLERQSKTWPAWKQEDLKQRLKRVDVSCEEPAHAKRPK